MAPASRPATAWSRVLALAAVAAAATVLAGCSIFGTAEPATSPTPEPTGSTDVFDLTVGDCITESAIEGEVDTVVVVDCATPHAREAFASITMDNGDFPGDQEVEDESVAQCTTAFDTFVGMDYAESTLQFATIYPTSGSWDAGDREILCLIADPAGDTTGSLENAQR